MASRENSPLLVNTDPDVDVQVVGIPESTNVRPSNKRGLIVICFTVLFYFVASSPMGSTTDQYVKQLVSKYHNDTDREGDRQKCLNGNDTEYLQMQLEIDSKTSFIMIMINCAGLVPQFVLTFLLGPCSDLIGRKIALILPCIGGCLRATIFIFVVYYELQYEVLCVGAFVEGCFGGFPLFFTACIATAADLTDSKQRSFWLCIIDITIGIGQVLTNVAGGYVIDYFGFAWMYLMAATTFFICSLLTLFAAKETVEVHQNVKIFTTKHVKRVIEVYYKDNGTNRRWKLATLLGIMVLVNLGNYERSDVGTFILINSPICFTPEILGFYVACIYIVKTVGCLLIMKLKTFGIKEGVLLLIGIGSYIGYQFILTWAFHIVTLFIATLANFGTLLTLPLARSLISGLGSEDEQGALFALATWLQTTFGLIATVYQNALYSSSLPFWRGFVFLVNSCIMGLSFLLACFLLIFWKREDIQKRKKLQSEPETNGNYAGNYGSINQVNELESPTNNTDNHNNMDTEHGDPTEGATINA